MATTDPVMVEFGAKVDGLTAGVAEVHKQLQSINSATEGLGAGFDKLKDVIAGAFSIEAIVSFVEKMAQLGLQTERVMATLGMSAGEVGMLGGMASVTGTSMEGLALSIERFSLNVQKSTRDALNPQAEALRVLGLNAKNLIGIPTSEYIDKLHDAVSKFNPSLNLTNAVMAVGGRGIAQIIPLLQMGGEEWEHMRQKITAAKDGLADAIPGMANTHQQIELMSMSVESLGAKIFEGLKPAIDGVVSGFTMFAQYVRDATKAGGALEGTFGFLTTAAKLLASAIVAIIATVVGLGVAVEALFKLAAGDVYEFQENAKKSAAAIEEVGRNLKKNLDEIWSQPMTVTIRKPGTDARAMNEGLQQAMTERLKVIENEYKLESDLINKNYGNFLLTEGVKTAELLAALQKRYQAEIAAGEKVSVAYSKFALDRQKILDAANKTYEAGLNNAFNGLQGAFNSQLRGMLAGTTTFTQAFKSILGDMIIWAIQEFEKMAFQWIAHEIIKTTATEAGVTARVAAETTGATASSATYVADALASIGASVAKAFASLTAFFVPVFGPAAPAAAAAVSAGVGAAAVAMIHKFDVGTDYVANTGLALVHQGEQIVPAKGSGPYTGANSSGSTNISLNISAVDARSFASLLSDHSNVLTTAIKRAMRDGHLQMAGAR